MSKPTIEIICRSLLAIVAALRKEYDLPEYKNIIISVSDNVSGILTQTPVQTETERL